MFIALSTVAGCDLDPVPVGEDPGETSTSGGTAATDPSGASGTENPADTDGVPLDVGGGGGPATDTGPGDTDPGDSGDIPLDVGGSGGGPCDPLLQDCADGEACYPAGDAFECSGPAGPSPVGGGCLDDEECVAGSFCGPEDTCTPYCDLDAPFCDDASATCTPWYPMGMAPPGLENVGWCFSSPVMGDPCDPLLQDCPAGDGCYPDGLDGFACAAAGPAQLGDACAGGCDVGLVCISDTCLELCDTAAPACTDPGHTCVDYYAMGSAPPGLETVGYCSP